MRYTNTNCVVAGGGGFLGQNITEELLDRGANVVIVDDFSMSDISNIDSRVHGTIKDDIRYVDLDRHLSRESPNRFFNDVDYFFNYATPPSIVNYKENPQYVGDVMVTGFMNSVQYCIDHDVRMIYPSSSSVYESEPPHRENDILPTEPVNIYGKTKIACELIHKAQKEAGLDAVGLRTFVAYGSDEEHKGQYASIVYQFLTSMMEGNPAVIYGDGCQKRDFMYIDDVVNASLDVGLHADENIVNIGTGDSYSFNEVVDTINDVLGTSIQPEYVDKPSKYLEVTQADTGIMSQYYDDIQYPDLQGGIKRTYEEIEHGYIESGD